MDLETFQNRVFPVKNKLYRFSYRLLGSSDEAKDVVQEVFLKLWNGRDQLESIHNVEAWCMRIARNLSLDRLRQSQRHKTDSLEQGMHVAAHTDTPVETAEMKESINRINELMAGLPDKQRQVMHLRDVEGYSYNEISEILELDLNQVKVNLFRARNTVRERLTKINTYGL